MSRSTTLAIVHSVDKLQGTDDAVRTQVWAETTHLLTPMLGKLYARFEPAQKACPAFQHAEGDTAGIYRLGGKLQRQGQECCRSVKMHTRVFLR